MVLPLQKISTAKADIFLSPEKHIVIRIRENAELDVDDMRAINSAKDELVADEKYTVLFIPPNVGTINREAREFSASKAVYRNAIAKAIVVKNVSNRLIANFFIQINKPPAPTKLFKTEEEALAWLGKMRENNREAK